MIKRNILPYFFTLLKKCIIIVGMINDPTKKMIREIIRVYQDRVLGISFLVLVPAAILLGLPTGQYSPSANWWHSVSQTYYAADSAIMIGILSSCGIMFITHRSKQLFERIVFVIAGISILGVVTCPHGDEMFEYVGLFHLPNEVSGRFHVIFATIMFISLGFLSIINFPLKGDDYKTLKAAKKRNFLFRMNGIIIYIASIAMLLRQLIPSYDWTGIVSEWFIFNAFGFNLLIKANIFKNLNE